MKINHYDSYRSFIDKMAAVYPDKPHYHDADFAGVDTFEEAYALARGGWHDRNNDVRELSDTLMDQFERKAGLSMTQQWDMVGGAFDYQSYLAGDPDCMSEFRETRQRQAGRIFRMLIDPGGNGMVSARFLMNRAAAIVTLLDIIQRSGNSLELWIASPVKKLLPNREEPLTPLFCLHPAGGVVDLDSIMFACGHPSFLRWMVFTDRHRTTRRTNHSFGKSVPLRTCDELLQIVEPDYLVERSEHVGYDEPSAGDNPEGWIMHTLEQLGVLDNEEELV